MGSTLRHRGPDDEGTWLDPAAGVGLAQRRLAIIDLSPAGAQPMVSRNGRYILNYNGEIYNHAEIRAELDQVRGQGGWSGHSDTETLIEAIACWGLRPALSKCVGMFALALWDRSDSRLHLARDRFGEKPLYYGWVGGSFAFASELKALRALPGFDNRVSREAVARYSRVGYVAAPGSIYERIYKLEPGCILSASPEMLSSPLDEPPPPGGSLVERYWSYRDVVLGGLAKPIRDEAEAVARLEKALGQAVAGQAVADVPVGLFLSGGIDSSTVAAIYRERSPVKTYTVGFEEAAFDEAKHAREVARYLGTDHHETYVTAREAQGVIPLLADIYDEPFGDSSQIPTYLVSKFARSSVKVALSGDGGDELFGGYNRHVVAPLLWARVRRLPAPLRSAVGRALGGISGNAWNGLADLLHRGSRQPHFGFKIEQALRALGTASEIDDVHDTFVDEWYRAAPVLHADGRLATHRLDQNVPDVVKMTYRDAVTYLPGDILAKVDRASMAVSLETRLPFLDHRVAELAAQIPADMKIRGRIGKHVLRSVLYRRAPRELFERPKTGFAVPVGEWLKGPLRDWAEDLLEPRKLVQQGWFDADRITRRWRDHLDGTREATAALWHVLMFQAWLANA